MRFLPSLGLLRNRLDDSAVRRKLVVVGPQLEGWRHWLTWLNPSLPPAASNEFDDLVHQTAWKAA
jgi:hypothetical protein